MSWFTYFHQVPGYARTGPPTLRNEDGQLVSFVFVDVNDDIGIADYVELAREVDLSNASTICQM